MKRTNKIIRTALFLVITMGAAISSAQESHTTLGIKGGMNVSRLSVSGLSDESNQIGYDLGAFLRLGLSRNFASGLTKLKMKRFMPAINSLVMFDLGV